MNSRKRSPRWLALVLAVLIPITGAGCPLAGPVAVKIAIKVGIWVGGMLISTLAGRTVEAILDKWVFGKDAKTAREVGKVVAHPQNPLRGTYKGEIRFTREDDSGMKRSFVVQDPPMVRDSEQATWKLAPEVRESVNVALGK